MTPPILRVDVSTGASALDAVDLAVGGPVPFVVARSYRSRRDAPPPCGPLGTGWALGLDAWIDLGEAAWTLHGGPFDGTSFTPVAEGREATQDATGLKIQSRPETVVVYASTRRLYVYGRAQRRGGRLPLVAVQDRAGAALTLQREGDRLVAATASDGRELRIESRGGRIREIVLRAGRSHEVAAQYSYTVGGELSEAIDAVGATTRFGWEGGCLVEVVDAEGARQQAQYDAGRRCLAVWHDRAPVAFALDYDPLRQITRAVDAAGGQTLYAHAARQVVERIAPAGHADSYLYDEASRLVGFVRDGRVATFQRLDPEDRRLAHIEAETRVAFLDYAANGLAAAVEDAFEARWTLEWEGGALVRLSTPLGHVWSIRRDALGRPASVTSPRGRRWTLQHGQASSLADADGPLWTETRDARGRPVSRTDRLGRTTTWTWRGAHLEGVAVRGPGEGVAVEAVRDALGRLVRLTDAPARRSVRYTYDAAGCVAACELDGRRIQIRNDGLHRPVEARLDGAAVQVDYDAQGCIARVITPAETYRYTTDGGTSTVEGAGGRRTYSALGELVRVEHADAVTEHTYGPSGELMAWTHTDGDHRDQLVFAYDAEGRIEHVNGLSAGALVEAWLRWDADGRLEHIRFGPEPESVSEDDPPATVHELALTYDPAGRLTRIAARDETTLSVDDGGRLTEVRGPGGRAAFEYDLLDRPIRAGAGGASKAIDEETVWQTHLAPSLVAAATPGGVLLGVELGTFVLPVWARGERRAPALSPAVRASLALTHGVAAALPSGPRLGARALDAWTPSGHRALWGDTTLVPRSGDLGLDPGPLDLFALDAPHLEAVAVPHVGATVAHQSDARRDHHNTTTGPHRTGRLRPAPWRSRSVGTHLATPDLMLRDGRLDPDALVDFLLERL